MLNPFIEDQQDPLSHFRKKFLIPRKNGKDQIYFLGNSLGLQPVTTPPSKGCQVSLVVKHKPRQIFEQLMENGIFADWREPDVIRVAPVPLYDTFTEVFIFSEVMKKLAA